MKTYKSCTMFSGLSLFPVILLLLLAGSQLPINGQGLETANFTLPKIDNRLQLKQTISTDSTFIATSLPKRSISGLSINASIVLKSEVSFIRVILIDTNYHEYLVFETNPLLASSSKFFVNNSGDESCSLPNVVPFQLRVELEDAEITIDQINFTYPSMKSASLSLKTPFEKRRAQLTDKITQINKQIKNKKLRWVAGETSVSKLSYSEKKNLLGKAIHNTYNFEYYTGGIFEIPGKESNARVLKSAAVSPYVPEFSWRNRHGKNWLTSIKSQAGCANCFAFSSTGNTEFLVNLYYNQQINLDLSEEDVTSCAGVGDCNGGSGSGALDYARNTGIVNESCFPFVAAPLPCSNKCTTPQEKIKIAGKGPFLKSVANSTTYEDTLKSWIMRGPVTFSVSSLWHSLVLAGYKTLKVGDRIYYKTSTEARWITIEAGNSLVGKTAWLFKNSWGAGWGDSGYGYIVTDFADLDVSLRVLGPPTGMISRTVSCVDTDGDGFYIWGIGPKPSTCPTCPDLQDGDDSDPTIGSVDKYGYTLPINSGDGLTGDYFPNLTLSGTPAITRIDNTINFSWGNGSPGTGIGVDNYSVRWTGQVKPKFSETYTFYTLSDDGVRLWVNGVLLVNNWTNHGPTENSNTIFLTAGERYNVVMEYYEKGGGATAKLSWSSASQTKQIIPQAAFYSKIVDAAPPSVPTNLVAGNIGQNGFTLRWKRSTDDSKITGYSVYQNNAFLVNVTDTVANISGLTPLTTYSFTVTATDMFAKQSALSNNLNVTTGITSKNAWQTVPVSLQNDTFTVMYDVTPNNNSINALTGIVKTTATTLTDLACIVRFNTNGLIDVLNGSTYAIYDTVKYTSGNSYHVRMEIKIPTHKYSVYVTPPGGTEKMVAQNYSFRNEQLSATSLSALALISYTNTHTVRNITFITDSAPANDSIPSDSIPPDSVSASYASKVIRSNAVGRTIISSDGENFSLVNSILIYPNPAHDLCNVQSEVRAVVKISDPSGKVVLTRQIEPGKTSIPISFRPGLYIVEVTDGTGQMQRTKLMVH